MLVSFHSLSSNVNIWGNWALFKASSGSDGKESACNAGDPGSIPGLGKSTGKGKGNPLQYSCLEKPARFYCPWDCKSQTWLSDETTANSEICVNCSFYSRWLVSPATYVSLSILNFACSINSSKWKDTAWFFCDDWLVSLHKVFETHS